MASIKRIFSNTFFFGVIPKIPTLVNVFVLPLITPFLTLDDYGIWGIISAYTNLFVCIAPLGLHMHLVNYFFEVKKWRQYWGHIYFIMLISGIICSAIYVCFIMVELSYITIPLRLLIALLSIGPILFFAPNNLASQLYPLLSKPLPLVLRNLFVSLTSISVVFVVVYYLKLGYWGWILGSFFSSLLSFILFGFKLSFSEDIKPIIEKKFRRIKNWFLISWPVIPHAIGFMLLTSVSRIIMSFYKLPLEEIGIYSNGYTMGDYASIFSIALATALSPEIQKTYREKRLCDYRHLFYFCQITALIVVFLLSCWMPEVYGLLMKNPAFHVAIPVACLICFANVLNPLYQFMANIVFITKHTKHLLWLVFVPGIINLILCLVLIPVLGYWGAVVASLSSFWSMLLIPFISKFHKKSTIAWLGSRKKLGFILLILIGCLILSHYFASLHIIPKIIISITILFVYAILLLKKKSLRSF